ncbi:LacI family DNA-binding transcriptional regulator [Nonomuraea sp. JJY05]|uniref:LacI family DNA-binding transcriptional regulator n=1 Tax=Nonomuraea sp. JJY05 TaxID=3350255 RepID=UPI00373E0909
MRDIAAAAAVSQSTVSRVLSGAPTAVPIAPETRQRVLRTARELGYRPNPLARGLRGASTNLIGAVVRDFSDPFFAGAIEALVVESMAHGYNVVLGHVPCRAGRATRRSRRLARAYLDDMGVHIPSADAEVAKLSCGQRQAIAVARSAYSRSGILLLDEPLAAMGAKEGRQILDLVGDLKSRGDVAPRRPGGEIT